MAMQFPHLRGLQSCRRCAHDLHQGLQRRGLHQSVAFHGRKGVTTNDDSSNAQSDSGANDGPTERDEHGPMARRLEEATEEALLTGGISGRRAVEDAGFSEELKEKLLDKVANAKFRQQYHGDFAQAGRWSRTSTSTSTSSSAAQEDASHIGRGSPWTGTESTADVVLRMLHDAHKPLKPGDRGVFQPPVVDARIRHRTPQSPGQRAANARDKANMYVGMDMKATKGLSDEERGEMRAELRERFQPAARATPATISGLTALANQRIEDAIARGQFKDLPRGKEMERDPRADNPFIDTTEYIMNKIIQRQEIAPPWIEKQQELTKAASVFRERLRNDWKRHASRMIASRGGSLQDQMKRAAMFAAAEFTHNPRHLQDQAGASARVGVDEKAEISSKKSTDSGLVASASPDFSNPDTTTPLMQRPFRDPDWERAERAYISLSIENINSITRSYNLMAPELAKKPYLSLERELHSCFADVAPLVADEIKLRAVGRTTMRRVDRGLTEGSNLAERIFGTDDVKIHLEADEKAYGVKEWWRDFWVRK